MSPRKVPDAVAAGSAPLSAPSATPEPTPERRRRPRIPEAPPVPAPPAHLDDYEPIIGKPQLDELRFLGRGLSGKTVKMVNSTPGPLDE